MDEIKVLLLDDDLEISYNLKIFLEDEGFGCTQTSNCEDAFQLLKLHHYDIIVVDIRLPGTSGDDFIVMVYEQNPEIKFIIHTGSAEFELTEELRKCGLSNEEIFRKPVENMNAFALKMKELLKK